MTVRERNQKLSPEYQAQKATIRRVLEIVDDHRVRWIREMEGVKPLPECSHACVLIADAIVREFGGAR